MSQASESSNGKTENLPAARPGSTLTLGPPARREDGELPIASACVDEPLGTLTNDATLDHGHVTDVLRAKIPLEWIEIKPTGETYLPQAHYRRMLCDVFGIGGWGMEPHREYPMPKIVDTGSQMKLTWPMWLVVRGRRVALGMGEASYFKNSARSSMATAAESAKSDALVRACKDLGIANELWDPVFSRWFQDMYGCRVYVDKGRNQRDIQWRRKDRPPLTGELGAVPAEGRPQVYPDPVSTDDPFTPSPAREPGSYDDMDQAAAMREASHGDDPRHRYDSEHQATAEHDPRDMHSGLVTQDDIADMMAKWHKTGREEAELKAYLARFEITSRKEIRKVWLPTILDWIGRLPAITQALRSHGRVVRRSPRRS